MKVRFATGRTFKTRAVVPVLLALSASALPALAQGSADDQRACTPDVFRLCSSEIPNVDRIVACLNRAPAKLSPACREVMTRDSRDARATTRTRAARSER